MAQLWAIPANAEPLLIRRLNAQSGGISPDFDERFVTFRLVSPDFIRPDFDLFFQTRLSERWQVPVRNGLGDLSVSGTVEGSGVLFIDNAITFLDHSTLQFSFESSPGPITTPSKSLALVNIPKFTFSGTLNPSTYSQIYELSGAGEGQLRLNSPFGEPIVDGTYTLRDPSSLRFLAQTAAPIPEPSTLLLLTGAGFAAAARQRRAANARRSD